MSAKNSSPSIIYEIVKMLTELRTATPNKRKWESHEFVYEQWTLANSWVCLASDGYDTLLPALDFFWHTYQSQILNEIQKWYDDGWEPMEEPGVQGFKLNWVEVTSHGIDPSDILLWFLTLGVALLMQLWIGELPRRYVTYEPIEYRLQMRRAAC